VRLLSLLVPLALACAQPSLLPGARLAPGDHARALAHGGAARSYLLHVPPRASSAPLPLVIAFHGGGGNAAGFQRYAGLDTLADRDGFLVAYPNGSSRLFEGRLLTWNAGACCGFAAETQVDDVGFALAVIEDVAEHSALDRSRIYATGHSNGAMMAYRLGAEAAERVAAIAPVAGAMALDRFAPGRAVPVLHIHSVDDPRARYAGGVTETLGRAIVHRPAEAELARWRQRNGCPEAPAVLEQRTWRAEGDSEHTATLLAWAPCADGSEVRLWKLTGAGHGWPGAAPVLPERLLGPRSDVISAADEVWAFLRRFALPRSQATARPETAPEAAGRLRIPAANRVERYAALALRPARGPALPGGRLPCTPRAAARTRSSSGSAGRAGPPRAPRRASVAAAPACAEDTEGGVLAPGP
jgi:polyhydroxybutyrate depolymerase